MKILQVSHLFLPDSSGGTEVYTHLLSKALQARHEVAVCHHISDKRLPEHELVKGTYDGLPTYRIVNNFTWSQGPDFEFFDPGQESRFEAVLDAVKPDIVHFQHLGGGLSTSFPSFVRRRGIPSVLTLHDFWPMCYRSHLLTSDGSLCVGPEGGLRCVNCWLAGSTERQVAIQKESRELGIRNALRMAPRYLLDWRGLREYLPPVAYHTTRLMARDTYFRRLLQEFSLLLAPSRFLRRRYIEWGIDAECIRYVQNGVDPTKFDGLCRDLPLGEVLQVAYVGSILRHKGLDVLIDAFNRLADLPVHLHIYGNTDSSPATKDYARSLRSRKSTPHVTFEGPFPNAEIGKVLSTADLLILPSILYENCPMTILEALYAGRPVVTSDVGGMAELIQDNVNGLTFRVGDAAHLADRIRYLAENREVLRTLHDNIVPPRTMEAVAAEVESCYETLLKERKA